MTTRRIGRRFFLATSGGALLSLPFLESLGRPFAKAENPPGFFLVLLEVNGVQQQPRFGNSPHRGETEGYWPDLQPGFGGTISLTNNSLPESKARALHELRGIEEHVSIVRGLRYNENDTPMNHHQTRRPQVMTGSACNFAKPDQNEAHFANGWGRHESFDQLVARTLGGDSSRTVQMGKNKDMYSISFDRLNQDGDTIGNPMSVYNLFFKGTTPTEPAQSARSQLVSQQVARELSSLKSHPRLSKQDRIRIEQHFDMVRAIETSLSCSGSIDDPIFASVRASQESSPKAPEIQDDGTVTDPGGSPIPKWNNWNYSDDTVKAFLTISAVGASCGAFKSAIVECDGGNFTNADMDFSMPNISATSTRDGFSAFHHAISHRNLVRGGSDFSNNGAGTQEHQLINRWFVRRFREMVLTLKDLGTLDRGISILTNEIATGAHETYDIPMVLAGNANGRLKNGVYTDLMPGASVDLKALTPNNRLLNTLGAALNLRSADGNPLHDFGGYLSDTGEDKDAGGHIDALKNWND